MKPLIAVAQMTSKDDLNANFATVEALAQNAQSRGASLLFLPENFAYFPKQPGDSKTMAEALDGPLFSRYRTLAQKLDLEISFGGFQEKSPDGRLFNTHVLVSSSGEIRASYRKIHLFVVDLADGTSADESAYVDAGSEIVTTESAAGKLGLSICYDLRFGELFKRLTSEGAQILAVPAAFTATTGKAHWEVLLRARAIENQCYVAAAAQIGEHHAGRSTHGHAMIIDPWGNIVAQCSDTTGLAFAEIDLAYLHRIRQSLPVAQHRRGDLFS